MPSAAKHLKYAHAHLLAADIMAATEATRSWSAVVLLYVARDVAHAVFDIEPGLGQMWRHPDSNTSRDASAPGTSYVIKQHFPVIEPAFSDLFATSKGVRYRGQMVPANRLAELRDIDLPEILAWASDRLSRADRQVPDWMSAT